MAAGVRPARGATARRAPTVALALLLGCGGGPAPTEAPTPSAAAPAAPQVARPAAVALAPARPPAPLQLGAGAPAPRRLLREPDAVRLRLPPHSRAPGEDLDDGALVAGPWTRHPAGGRWSAPSPLSLPYQRYRDAAPGVRLRAGAALLPWGVDVRERGAPAGAFEVEEGKVWVAGADDPGAGPPLRLESDAAAAERRRLHLDSAGLRPWDFAHIQPTIGPLTREALLVPAPGAATWSVQVQAGDALRLGVGLLRPADDRAPGAATAQVWAADTLLWEGAIEAGAPWQELRLPLDRWAGQRVDLRLESLPGADPAGDFVVFAEPEVVPAPSTPARRVVVVGLDTLRADRLGLHGATRPITPNLDQIGAQSILFDDAYAPAPRTRPSFRTLLTGRWPLPAIEAPTIGRRFADAGFTVGGVVANVHLLPNLGFADGAGAWAYHDSAPGSAQVDRALSWLEAHAHEDSFLFLHLMDPHVFYEPPPGFDGLFADPADRGDVPARFNRWTVREWEEKGSLSAAQRRWISDRYDEEVASLDHELGRLVAALDALPGETLLVLASDHGEELWDHGAFEHNHSLHQELVRAVLWVRPPGGWAGGPHRRAAPTSLADLAPTLHRLFGLPGAPTTDGLDLLPLLVPGAPDAAAAAPFEARALPLGHLMFHRERWGVVVGGQKYVVETSSGAEQLFDLRADPGEQHDLAPTLDPARRAALVAALGAAVDAAAGPGWRFTLKGAQTPFTLRFDAPVEAAAVIDPEAARLRRANLEWGERPPVRPDDVARIQLAPDRRSLRVEPGPVGEGVIAVLGLPPTAQVSVEEGATTLPLRPGAARLGGALGQVSVGVVIFPRDSEAARLAARAEGPEREALRAMGYVE
jgi:arylsulfatase A-like enzyme